MASTWRHPNSSYWTACYSLPDGTRVKKSTKLKERKKALEIAVNLESAARRGLTEAHARHLIADLYSRLNSERLPSQSVEAFFNQWLARRKVEVRPGTFSKYENVTKQFLAFLGDRRQRDISAITSRDVAGFRDALSERLSIGSANIALKIVKTAFGSAFRDSLISVNEAAKVPTLTKSGERAGRRPFTMDELQRLFAAASGEWRGLILTSFYTGGQRLGDVARLTWQNVDLERAEIRFVTRKTGRRQIIPMAAPLLSWFESLPSTDNPKDLVFPKTVARLKASKNEYTAALSNGFHEILVQAGLAQARTHQRTANGRSARRKVSELSFHSLRHTATSLLKNAGISAAIVQDIVGHESEAISANYTHIDEATKRLALDSLPDISAQKTSRRPPKRPTRR
jgi:integrase